MGLSLCHSLPASGARPRPRPQLASAFGFHARRVNCKECWRLGTAALERVGVDVDAQEAKGDAPQPELDLPLEDNVQFIQQFQEDIPSFADLGVDPILLPPLVATGISAPCPIQEAAIPVLLRGADAAVQSYTGSGKTLAYLLPVLSLALARAEEHSWTLPAAGRREALGIQALVVAPSQELCMQIVRVAQGLLPPQLRSAVQQCIGGANPRRQADALAEHRPLLVVGTPGRVAELVRTAALKLHQCPILVLDEADQLLADNFSEDLAFICQHAGRRLGHSSSGGNSGSGSGGGDSSTTTSSSAQSLRPGDVDAWRSRRQTVLVSATLTQTVLSRFARWCPDPQFITSGGAPALAAASAGDGAADAAGPGWGWGARGWEGPASGVAPRTQGAAGGAEAGSLMPTLPPQLQHLFVVAQPRHKVDTLRRLLHAMGMPRALVFMNFQQRLQDTAHKLAARGLQAGVLHGEMGKLARQNVLDAFRRGAYPALLASDVAARGLDLPQLDVVVHLELPSSAAHYAHRAGRTGRMGAAGIAVSVVEPRERFVVDRLAARLGVPLLEVHLKGGEVAPGPAPPEPRAASRSGGGRKEGKGADSRRGGESKGNGSAPGAGGKGRREEDAAVAATAAERAASGRGASSSGGGAGAGGDKGGKGALTALKLPSVRRALLAGGDGGAAPALRVRRGADGAEEIDDLDDEVDEDALRADLRGREGRKLRDETGAARDAARQRLLEELKAELEEIRAEKRVAAAAAAAAAAVEGGAEGRAGAGSGRAAAGGSGGKTGGSGGRGKPGGARGVRKAGSKPKAAASQGKATPA